MSTLGGTPWYDLTSNDDMHASKQFIGINTGRKSSNARDARIEGTK